MFGILLHVIAKMEKNLASIMNDSAITCNVVKETKTILTNFIEKKATSKM